MKRRRAELRGQRARARGKRTGRFVTAAEPYPPRPLALEEGAVVALRASNFPEKYVHARPAGVVISEHKAISGGGGAAAADATAFFVRSARSLCPHDSDLPPWISSASTTILLESCAYPGLVLAHGLNEGSPLRLALPPTPPTASSSSTPRACLPGLLFTPRTPGLVDDNGAAAGAAAADGGSTATLLAVTPTRQPNGQQLVVRHAWGKLQTSSTSVPATDKLLAADASWLLSQPPSGTQCTGREIGRRPGVPFTSSSAAAGAAAAEAAVNAGDLRVAQRAAQLASPTHHATLHFRIGSSETRSATFALYGNVAPRTVDNFVKLCNGGGGGGEEGGGGRKYEGTRMQRIMPGFMAQGGSTDGGYGEAYYGGKFADESFALGHDSFGTLSMANAGPDTNGSQFFITFGPQPHLDGKHVVFGRLVVRGGADGEEAMEARAR